MKISELPSSIGSDDDKINILPAIKNPKLSDHVYFSEEDAINKIKEIFANGNKPFILPYRGIEELFNE